MLTATRQNVATKMPQLIDPSTTACKRRLGTHVALVVAVLVALTSGCIDTESGIDFDRPSPYQPGIAAGAPCFSTSSQMLANTTSGLRVHFIDVGQGDAILIQTPDDGIPGNGTAEGLNIMVDAGDSAEAGRIPAIDTVEGYLRRLGVERIDFAIVSHAHTDHFGGLLDVLQRFDVVNVVEPGANASGDLYQRLPGAALAETSRHGGRFMRPALGQWVENLGDTVDGWGDELTVRVIYANDVLDVGEDISTQVNNTSIVFSITYEGKTVLFMGDAEREVESLLVNCAANSQSCPYPTLEGIDLRADILKVGHHGSSSSSTRGFLQEVFGATPENERYAVISSGRRSFNGTTLPSEQTLYQLYQHVPTDKLLRTDFQDEEKSESDAPGDDHVVAVIEPGGEIRVCYVPDQ